VPAAFGGYVPTGTGAQIGGDVRIANLGNDYST